MDGYQELVKIEIAIEDVDGAITAEKSGAHRVEVCSELSVGGLTPSIGIVREILRRTSSIDLAIMIRPRAGNFTYSPSEIATMVSDLEAFNQLDFGNRNVSFVFGALDTSNYLDSENLEKLLKANTSGHSAFHMAFDSTPDLITSLSTLISLGFERVLTSGGAANATAGIEKLKELQRFATGKITVIAGGSVRAHNARLILDATGVSALHLRASEPITSPGTGKYDALTLYRTSASQIEKVLNAIKRGGRKPAILVVDIGGTSLKGAVLTPRYEIEYRTSVGTDVETLESDLFALISSLIKEAELLNFEIISLGVVSPGSIDKETGSIIFASNLGWRNYPLAANLRDKFNVPVAVGHDVRTAVLAEGAIGAAPGIANFISVVVGTGIAVGIVDKGEVISGFAESAGESGHMPLVFQGALCPCGQRGCWERYSSGHGISERFTELTGEKKSSAEIMSMVNTNSEAEKVWRDAITKTAQALAILVVTLDPQLIVIGGGVASGYATSLPDLQRELQSFLTWKSAPEIKISTLGEDAGIYGAAILASSKIS
ncbi:MAG: copper homeostasis protein CutC [Candidatus Planktophila sp.]